LNPKRETSWYTKIRRSFTICKVKKVKLSLCLTNYTQGVWGRGCTDKRILDLGTGGFTPQPLNPRHPLDRWLGGLQNRSGRHGREKSRSYRDSNLHQTLLGRSNEGEYARQSMVQACARERWEMC
jgi:hypothetical protein